MRTQSNAQIIFNQQLELMKAGTIGTTGRTITITVEKEGQKVQEKVNEPEPIHTYKEWQRLGFQVEKGQKAIAIFTIWNFAENKKDKDEEEAPSLMKNGYYYMKKAAFFKFSQVKKAEDTTAAVPETEPEPAPEVKKAARKTSSEKAYSYISKKAEKNPSGTNLCGTINGITYACDGVQVMKTTEPATDKEIEKAYADTIEKMLDSVKNYEKTGTINLTAKEIREGIKAAKAGSRNAKVIYTTADGISFNADFLLNAITATGATEYTWDSKKAPAIFKSESTTYMLCPINSKEDTPEGFKVIG